MAMKTTSKISLVLNFGLAGTLVFVLLNGQKISVGLPLRTMAESRLPVRKTAPAPQILPVAEPKPFHWDQLDATDYHLYVRNLRNIGCPEPTLRAIVSGDVHAAYGEHRHELEQKLSQLAAGSWSMRLADNHRETALRMELQALPGAEASKIEELLGLATKPAPMDLARDELAEPQPVPEPLIFQPVDPAKLNLTSEQSRIIDKLRQNFLQEIGGTNQDPNNPAYLERWQKAQPEADAVLRGMLGTSLYQNYQMAALAGAPNSAVGTQ